MVTDVPQSVGAYFKVAIDDGRHELGTFTSCEGLAMTVHVESREEGGNNGYVHRFPGPVSYSNVRFTRAVNADSPKLAAWFSSLQQRVQRTTMQISLMSVDGRAEVASWSLDDVVPVSWTGPVLSSENPQVAIETFEIAHHGFLSGT